MLVFKVQRRWWGWLWWGGGRDSRPSCGGGFCTRSVQRLPPSIFYSATKCKSYKPYHKESCKVTWIRMFHDCITEFTTTYSVRKRCYLESSNIINVVQILFEFNDPFLYVFLNDKVGRFWINSQNISDGKTNCWTENIPLLGAYNPCIKRDFHLFSSSNDYD